MLTVKDDTQSYYIPGNDRKLRKNLIRIDLIIVVPVIMCGENT